MKTAGIPTRLEALRYPPEPFKPHPSSLARGVGFVLAVAAAASTGGLALSQALSGAPIAGPGGVWGSVAFLSLIAVFAAALSSIPLRIRGFSVRDGVITLVTPVRTVSGERVRYLPLTRIAHAERIVEAGADPGILIILKDGTRIPVFEADLQHGGSSFLDSLVRVTGETGHDSLAKGRSAMENSDTERPLEA